MATMSIPPSSKNGRRNSSSNTLNTMLNKGMQGVILLRLRLRPVVHQHLRLVILHLPHRLLLKG